jgi:hypothetical protein
MKTTFTVVLALAGLAIADLIKKALFIVDSMTGNPNFSTPSPALTVIGNDVTNLETAQTKASGGGKPLTAAMHAQEAILVRDLNALGNYVETIANNDPANAVSIILSAGMEVKADATHGPTKFHAELTSVAGEVKLKTAFILSVIYHWQMSTDGTTFAEIGVTRKGTFIKGGFTLGTRYYFRVATEDNNGLSTWSDVTSIIVA